MNKVFETNFTVMPDQANYMYPLIFGGAFFAQMDLCAAQTVSRFLHDSKTCKGAVTYKAEPTWFKPCYVGDLIFLKGVVTGTGKKSIIVEVTAHRERRGSPERDKVAISKFVFVSISAISEDEIRKKPDLLPYAPHGLDYETR